MLDHFSNRARIIFDAVKCALAWTLVIFAIALLAWVFLYDVIDAAKECHTFNILGNCVENRLMDL